MIEPFVMSNRFLIGCERENLLPDRHNHDGGDYGDDNDDDTDDDDTDDDDSDNDYVYLKRITTYGLQKTFLHHY
jgi:hypothetical protein